MEANKQKRALHCYQNESKYDNDWYFGSITRTESENILNAFGLSEGLFLVRQSVSSPGDYVLSCVHKGSVVHYQIRKIGDDPIFSIDSGVVIHGLDMLLEHFRELSATNESLIFLRNHCRCSNPPSDTLRHGRSNLLHRSIAGAQYKVVSELLQSEVKLNLEARNERGRTALHLAVELDENKDYQIVEQLIEVGVNVNCKDSESITPLHLCAKLNKPKFTKLLIIDGKAKTFVRTNDGWVALHFAAFYGNVKVVKTLLECGAAPHPRNNINETPTDLAKKEFKCKKLCHFYSNRAVDYLVPKSQWLFEHLMSRWEANRLFEHSGMKDGSFLVRKSRSKLNAYVLGMAFEHNVYNFEIQFDNQNYFIDTGPYWPSLEHMICYYMRNSDGLPSRLSAPLSSFIDISMDRKLIQSNTKNNESFKCNENNAIIKSILFIDNKELKVGPLIGTGEYGNVFKGIWSRPNKEPALVAIKILRKKDVQKRRQINNFLKEVEVMTSVKHPNIIKLLGVCTDSPLMMIQELAPMGSVLDFLIDCRNQVKVSHDIKLWSFQIAIAMKYLESLHIVHRDLAARNVLLVSNKLIKISDFGLSRALRSDQQLYEASTRDRWPLRWYAPESIKHETFTHASDVWSYGIVLWEMYSFGDQPYEQIANSEIIGYIEGGKRLSKPEECSDFVFALMSLCWSYEPKNRPTFHEIVEIMFTNDCTYESMRNELKSAIEM